MTKQKHPGIRVGDTVKLSYGTKKLVGTVVENRGAIGVNGRILYKVSVELPDSEPLSIELPANELQVSEAINSP